MTNFEKVTVSPEALGEFLAALSVATGPWDKDFYKAFCEGCGKSDCGPARMRRSGTIRCGG